tara:strand:+ start:2444 stop:3190 length:747 start_codon:yes stop_codon:yes gene_type:complete
MSKNVKITGDSREEALDILFGDASDESQVIIDLPSRGNFYPGFKGIEIKPLTFSDEQKILGSRNPQEDLVSKLLEKTISGVDVDDLVSMDKMFLLMKVREISYGENYEFSITCPACDTSVQTSLHLSDHLNIKKVPEDLEDPREIMLPKLKVKAKVRFPRSREEVLITNPDDIIKNIYRFVTSINDNKDPVFISKAIKRMHIMDVKKIVGEVSMTDYGINPKFIFECPECNYSETMSVPLDVGFFSVS